MDYIEQIFSRADIQQIRAFLLHGAEDGIDPRPYRERENAALKHLMDRLLSDPPKEEDELCNLVCAYGLVCQKVYMEIGLQIGAKLAVQACRNLG